MNKTRAFLQLATAHPRAAVAAAAVAASAGAGLGIDATPTEPSALVAYQIRCTQAHAFHDQYIYTSSGGRMAFTDGEAHRPASVARLYASQGLGIADSLHIRRLARDKMLILDGKYTPDAQHYRFAGEVWEAIGPAFEVQTAWGGRFNDANHFSCTWGGRK